MVNETIDTKNLNNSLKSPISIQLELTKECNCKCVYCYNYWNYKSMDSKGDKSSPEDFKYIIDKIKEAEIFQVVITGGEPFTKKNLAFDIIKYSLDKNLEVEINTNLSILNSGDIEELGKLDVGFLISFPNSKKEKYQQIMNSSRYDKFVSNLELLMRYKNPLTINMVVTQLNKNDVYETGRFLSENFGVNSFSATPISGTGGAKEHNKLSLDLKEVILVLDDLIRLNKDFGLITDSLQPLPFCIYTKEDIEKYTPFLTRTCAAGKSTATISPNGDMRPCSHAQQVYGNTFENSIKEIWKNMEIWRTTKLIPQDCKICSVLDYCMAGCRTNAECFNSSISAEDPLKQKAILNGSYITKLFKSIDNKLDKNYKGVTGIKYRNEKEDIFSLYHNGRTLIVNKSILEFLLSQEPINVKDLNENGLKIVNELLNKGFLIKV